MNVKYLACMVNVALLLGNLFLLSVDTQIEYSKDTCNRSYWKTNMTPEELKECGECDLSRIEAFDNFAYKYIAHIAYTKPDCAIDFVRVDEAYKKQGIGKELVSKALEDLFSSGCTEVSLISARSAEAFWEKLGAQPRRDFSHVFTKS